MSRQLDNIFERHKSLVEYGPRAWRVLHKYAFRARSTESQHKFISLLRHLQRVFPCDICGGHIKKYLIQHPPERYIGFTVSGLNIGMFVWLNKFHNSVNLRKDKSVYTLETSYNLYNELGKMQRF